MGSEEIEKEKQAGIGKQVVRLAFSHIGLCVIVIVYCVIGGLLFELLEKQNEISACLDARKEYDDMENDTLFSLLDVVLTTPLGSHEANAQLVGVFESFRNNTFQIGYEGEWCEGYGKEDGPVHEWTFAGGLFFSMTIITTIEFFLYSPTCEQRLLTGNILLVFVDMWSFFRGYGHISPSTVWGRIFCISYAMMGIPLMLMFLANIGDVLADIFRYIYAKIICCGCMRKRKKKRRTINRKASEVTEEPKGRQLDSRVPSSSPRSNGKSGDLSRSPSSCDSNEGLVPDDDRPSSSRPGSAFSNKVDVTHRNSIPKNIKTLNSFDIADRARLRQMVSKNSQKEPLVLDDEESDDEDEEEWEEIGKVAVPLTVSCGIIGLYIIGGAILFKYWEGWDMLQSSYFCFITLSTIGFGDVTPGRDFTDPTANARLVIGTVYSIFGMAILSMCFTLMQEEMISKFRWIGQKLGVINDEDDDDDDFSSIEVDKTQNMTQIPPHAPVQIPRHPPYKASSDC